MDLYQVCSNYNPGAENGPAPESHVYIDLYRENMNIFCLKPPAWCLTISDSICETRTPCVFWMLVVTQLCWFQTFRSKTIKKVYKWTVQKPPLNNYVINPDIYAGNLQLAMSITMEKKIRLRCLEQMAVWCLSKSNKTKLCSGPASRVHTFNVWTVDMQSLNVQE